jgi:hypothetical protein
MVAVEGLLCVLLMRGWEKNRSRAIAAGILYLWMCVSYEAFYLQWIPLILIGVVLWRAKRVTARPVIASAIALLAAQAVAAAWNMYTRQAGYYRTKLVIVNWGQVPWNLSNLAPAVIRSVYEIAAAAVVFGGVVTVIWLAVCVRSLWRASDRPAGYTSVLLAGIPVLGGIISIVVFSLAGRVVTGTGVENRSLLIFNFWIVIAATVLTVFAMERLRRLPKLVFVFGLAGLGLCLAVGQVLRASDWVTAWNRQQKLLAEAPIADLRRTEPDACIVIVNPRGVNDAPIFAAPWDIKYAILWTYPFLQSRRFIVYNPWEGPMTWNGKELGYPNQPALETTAPVYFWRPSDQRLWRPSGPVVIHQDLSVEPAH